MPNPVDVLQPVLGLVLSIVGYRRAARRPGHTRRQVITGAAVGGGLAGAVTAAYVAAAGGSLSEALPFAILGAVFGVLLGIAGLLARGIGRWLDGRPE